MCEVYIKVRKYEQTTTCKQNMGISKQDAF